MKTSFPIFLITILITISCLISCSDKAQQRNKLAVETKQTKEAKPGAPITLSSSSLVTLNANQPTQIEIQLETKVSEGELQLDIAPTIGLELQSTQNQQKLNPSKPIKIPVILFAKENGRYYLNLHLNLRNGDSVLTRNLAVIVQVGSTIEEPMKFKKSASDNVISLPAKETISNQ